VKLAAEFPDPFEHLIEDMVDNEAEWLAVSNFILLITELPAPTHISNPTRQAPLT